MDKIIVFYSFARSGGTLVNQLLGIHPNCAVLSEVNPAASFKAIADQATDWFDLVKSEERYMFSRKPYSEQIMQLYACSKNINKKLIIRDWVTVNFLPGCAGNLISPSGHLEQNIYLKHAGFEILPLVITRRSSAIFKSIKENFPHLKSLQKCVFAKSYLQFAQVVSNFTIVHLEDLCARPEATLLKILKLFELDAVKLNEILETFHKYEKCTGNNSLAVPSRSSMARAIFIPDSDLSHNNIEDDIDQSLHKADRLLGYE